MATKTVEERRAQLSSFWDNGPGPARFMLPPTVGKVNHDKTRKENPAWSLGLKLPSVLVARGNGPGPIYLINKGLTAKGPQPQIGYTIKSRTRVIENFNTSTPGPAAYLPHVNVNRRKAPEYSLAYRTRLIERGRFSPGPIYLLPPALGPRVPDKPAAAEVSIKGKGRTEDEVYRSPGPIYDIGSPNLTKHRGGEMTIKGRWKELKSQSCGAGPGSYNIDQTTKKIWHNPPAFSLGIRHTPFAGVFMTKCDKLENASPSFDDCDV